MKRFLTLVVLLVSLAIIATAVVGFVMREELTRRLDLARFNAAEAEVIAQKPRTIIRIFEAATDERPLYMVSADLTDPKDAGLTLMGARERAARNGPLDPVLAQSLSDLVDKAVGAKPLIERGDAQYDDMCSSAYVWKVEIIKSGKVSRFVRTACVDRSEPGYDMIRAFDAAVPKALINCAPASEAYGLLTGHQACIDLARNPPTGAEKTPPASETKK